MAKKNKSEERGRGWKPWYIGMRVDIPEPKGEFRNVFEDVIEQMKSRKDAQSKSSAPRSE